MSGVDFSKLKPGDEVLVRMRVISVGGNSIRAIPLSGSSILYAYLQDIHSALPRPIRVGDRVYTLVGNLVGAVLAIHEGQAWVNLDKGGSAIWRLDQLKRVIEGVEDGD